MKSNSIRVLWVATAFACVPRLPSSDEVGDEVAGSSDSTGPETSTDSDSSDSSDATSSDSTGSEATTDTGPIECEPVYEGSLVLDEDTTPAEFESLACVEHVTGDLVLSHTTVAQLEFLSALVHVDGDLKLFANNALLDLHGLDALAHVGGQLVIESNDALLDMHGLESLDELGGLRISFNPSLVGLDGLGGAWHLHAPTPEAMAIQLSIVHNDALASLDALGNVGSVVADLPVNLSLIDNEALIGDLTGLASIVASDLDLALTDQNNALESLTGLEALTHARSISLLGTGSQYTSLVGLDNLVSVEHGLIIGICAGSSEVCADCDQPYNHYHLASLDGLESLQQVGALTIWGNLVLADIDALAGLQTIEDVQIGDNPVLSQAGVESLIANVDVLGNVGIWNNGTGNEPVCGFIPP